MAVHLYRMQILSRERARPRVLPILNAIARSGIDEETGQLDAYTSATLWTGIAIVLALSRVGTIAYSSVSFRCIFETVADWKRLSMILNKENAPSPAALGQSNGIIQFAMCLARSFARS